MATSEMARVATDVDDGAVVQEPVEACHGDDVAGEQTPCHRP